MVSPRVQEQQDDERSPQSKIQLKKLGPENIKPEKIPEQISQPKESSSNSSSSSSNNCSSSSSRRGGGGGGGGEGEGEGEAANGI